MLSSTQISDRYRHCRPASHVCDCGEKGVVGDGDVVTVVLDGAEFVEGVECFGDLSGGRGVCGGWGSGGVWLWPGNG